METMRSGDSAYNSLEEQLQKLTNYQKENPSQIESVRLASKTDLSADTKNLLPQYNVGFDILK